MSNASPNGNKYVCKISEVTPLIFRQMIRGKQVQEYKEQLLTVTFNPLNVTELNSTQRRSFHIRACPCTLIRQIFFYRIHVPQNLKLIWMSCDSSPSKSKTRHSDSTSGCYEFCTTFAGSQYTFAATVGQRQKTLIWTKSRNGMHLTLKKLK